MAHGCDRHLRRRHVRPRVRGVRRRQPLLRGHRRLHPLPRPRLPQAGRAVGDHRRAQPASRRREDLSGSSRTRRSTPSPGPAPSTVLPGQAALQRHPGRLRRPRALADRPEYRDRDARLARMDAQGLDGCFLFPTLGVGIEEALAHDVDALYASFRAFNRWLEDDWGYAYQDRIFAAADAVARRPGPGRGRAGPGARRRRPHRLPAGRPDPHRVRRPLARRARVRPVLEHGRRGRHHRRLPLGRQRLRPLRRRLGRRRRDGGVPLRPVPHAGHDRPADARDDRRPRHPRRVRRPPAPAGRDHRERVRLGARAVPPVQQVLQAGARGVPRRSHRDVPPPRVGGAVLRGRHPWPRRHDRRRPRAVRLRLAPRRGPGRARRPSSTTSTGSTPTRSARSCATTVARSPRRQRL